MPRSFDRQKPVFSNLPMLLLAVSILAYGLLIPRLGFAWDDLLAIWIRYRLGVDAMMSCFNLGRPFMGWFFQLTTSIFPPIPVYWHIFAIFWRWAGAAVLWALVRNLWRGRSFMAAAIGLLFLVYPGFSQQFVSYTYSHYFAVLCFYLLSMLVMVWSLQHPHFFWPLTILALLLSAANLFAFEYFLILELFRPFVIWLVLQKQSRTTRSRLRQTLVIFLPYLGIFLVAIFGKIFLFPNQLYSITALDTLQTTPVVTLLVLFGSILKSLWLAIIAAWGQVFLFPTAGQGSILWIQLAVMAVTAGLVVLCTRGRNQDSDPDRSRRDAVRAAALGGIAMFLAGWPFWLIRFPVILDFPNDRFTLPFMLGVSLLTGGLLELVPTQILKVGLLAILTGMAAGRQVLVADKYAREWELQKSLFWQMTWRIPALEPGTLILMNDGALDYYADNSLSAPLNWIYSPGNTSSQVDYLLFHPRSRLGGSLPAVEPELPINYRLVDTPFDGNTSQTLALDFNPPGCLRVLDPDLDPVNRSLHETMRTAASFSRSDLILLEGDPVVPALFGPEPGHGWCYYFAKAGLEYQRGDWKEVVNLGDAAMAQGLYPSYPHDWLIFIEAYAYTGAWNRAQEVTTYLSIVVPDLEALFCRLWQRINVATPDTEEKRAALNLLPEGVTCQP